MKSSPSLFWTILGRGLRRRCPQCGEGKIFRTWMGIHAACNVCGLHFKGIREEDTWGWMYFSTAFMTGWVILGMFLFRPQNLILGVVVVILAALILMFGTLPFRKGLAFAMDYWIELRTNPEAGLQYRPPKSGKTS